MSKPIYVFGHRNPDTDSICSAIAYAHLKRCLGQENVVAARLGKVSKETQFALDYFGVKEPVYIDNIKPQVGDANHYATPPVYVVDSVKKAWDIMTKHSRQMIPVLYPDHKLAGVISVADIAKTYIGLTDGCVLKNRKTPFVNIPGVLEGRVIHGEYPEPYVQGEVYTTASIAEDVILKDTDIIITGNNKVLIQNALATQAGCIVITDVNMDKIDIKIPEESTCAVICTPMSFFKTIKIISQSISVKNLLGHQNLVYFQTDDTIDEAKEIMLNTSHRHFPILNKEGQVKGVISKRHIVDIKKKQVILVDHNEKNQSAEGIEQAEILEIIDHHRIANIDTGAPVYLRAEPVGCTSTIIAKMYMENNLMPPMQIAGIMLSAILSDTLVFKSPTCTSEDIKMAKRLAQIAEVDIQKYGAELIGAGTSLEGVSANELLEMDRKQSTIGKYNTSISQINTGDFKSIFELKDEIISEMDDLIAKENLDLVVFMITDLIIGGTELMIRGREKWIAEKAFNIPQGEEGIFLPDVYSRKKQIVPNLMMSAQDA